MKHVAFIRIDYSVNDCALFQIFTPDISILINMSYEDFAQMVTGLSRVEVVYSMDYQGIVSTDLNGLFTISKDNHDLINITLVDKTSRLLFVKAKITMSDFGMVLLGRGNQLEVQIEHIELVGKTRIQEQRVAECPLVSYDRKLLEDWLVKNVQEDGYSLSPYLGTQGSVIYQGDKTYLHYKVYKYI